MIKSLMSLLFLTSLYWSNPLQAQEYSDDQIIQMYSPIGDIHNQGLDFILLSLKNQYGNVYQGGKTNEDRLRMNEAVYTETKIFLNNEISVTDIDLNQFIHPEIDIRDIVGKDIVSALETFEEGRSLSSEFMQAMQELNSIMDDIEKSSIRSDYDRIIQENIGRLDSFKEKVYLVSCVNIGFSSINYWNEKTEEWQAFGGSNTYAKLNNIKEPNVLISSVGLQNVGKTFWILNRAKDVAKADVAGIITGGIGGCAYGAIGGTIAFPGVGTIAGCAGLGAAGALTGGLGGSAVAAVNSFVSWLFGD